VTADYAWRFHGASVTQGSFTLGPLDLGLPTGYIMGLVGPNGAGKTTTIRTLLGMTTLASGQIEVLGAPVPGPAAFREGIGVVLDHSSLVGEWTLHQVERALSPFYSRWEPSTYADLLERFGLTRRARVKELSRGTAMKLQVAIALSHGARLLLLDEPTSGLDPVAREDFVGILGDFLVDESHSVLFSTHITSDLERVADLVAVLRDGEVVAAGPTDELRDSYCIVKGGHDELPDNGIVALHGARRTAHGVEALIQVDDIALVGPGVIAERPTLDQIVVHLGAAPRSPTFPKVKEP